MPHMHTFEYTETARARRIVESTGVAEGHCIELGGGAGLLGIAIGLQTAMRITICDPETDVIEKAMENVRAHDMQFRVTGILGSADNLPFSDSTAELIVCHDSILENGEPYTILEELSRVLKPGGIAVIGNTMADSGKAAAIKPMLAKLSLCAHLDKGTPGIFLTLEKEQVNAA